ncbi:MAG: hypothetical protein C4309_02235, partial [Chloroflexota bacterium]
MTGGSKMAQRVIPMYQAIAEAIRQEMERDSRVFVMGEDVGLYGGIFGATYELWKRFGDERRTQITEFEE